MMNRSVGVPPILWSNVRMLMTGTNAPRNHCCCTFGLNWWSWFEPQIQPFAQRIKSIKGFWIGKAYPWCISSRLMKHNVALQRGFVRSTFHISGVIFWPTSMSRNDKVLLMLINFVRELSFGVSIVLGAADEYYLLSGFSNSTTLVRIEHSFQWFSQNQLVLDQTNLLLEISILETKVF